MIKIILNPHAFFEQNSPSKNKLLSTFIVLLAIISTVFGALLFIWRITQEVPSSAEPFVLVGFVIGILASALGTLGTWFGIAVLFHIIATKLYDGDGDLRKTVYATAWGFLPVVFNGIVTAIFIYILLRQAEFPADPSQIDPYIDELRSAPLYQTTKLIAFAFLFWQGAIWEAAVNSLYDLSIQQSAGVVSVPLLFILGYQIQGLL